MSAEEIFHQALARPQAERPAFLAAACAGDEPLERRIEALLHAHENPGSFLAAQPPEPAVTIDTPVTERAGTVIGPYKLLELLGEGGMGAVWMAQQTEPVKRLVALKLIKAGMDSKPVLARFEAERQALALMDHPNIARVLDAGTTAAGRPYFVMELVKGVLLTRYCDEHRLAPRERLELFVPVCQAVQHAHQKGIIHRDLKPSNVLIALYDGRPVPKVIDFGIAKATGQQLTEHTLVTGFGAVVGTLEYMSPEQAELNQLDIDTRSDIYSLGVLLYELLTGTTPLDKKRLKEVAMLEVLRLIREEEPPRPSTRLSTTAAMPSIAANRGLAPNRLTGLVRGELDWIVMKALEKDRNRRYETANGFAMDVQRYLAGEPVLAAPASQWYRLRKLVRRHRGPVGAAGLVLLTLVYGIAGTTWGLRWAMQALAAEQQAREDETRARQQAFTALRSMTEDVVEKKFAQGTVLTDDDRAFLRGVIAQYDAFATIKGDDADSRAVRAEGRWRVGNMRARLGELQEAGQDYDQALSINKQLVTEFPDRSDFRGELAKCYRNRGGVQRAMGRLQEAEQDYDRALSIYHQLAADFPGRPEFGQFLAQALNVRGTVLRATDRLPQAAKDYDEALGIQKRLAEEFPARAELRRDLAASHTNRGNVLRASGRLRETEQDFDAALNIYQRLVADFPSRPEFRVDLARSYGSRGILLSATGRLKAAEQDFNQAVSIDKQLAADFPSRPEFRQELAWGHGTRANLLRDTGRPKEAEQDFDQALSIFKELATDFSNRPEFRQALARSHNSRGILLDTAGRLKEAEQDYDQAVSIQKLLVADFPSRSEFREDLANSYSNRGMLLIATGRLDDAEKHQEQALRIHKQQAADFPNQPDRLNDVAGTYVNLAILYRRQGKWAAARQLLLEGQPHHLAALKVNPRNPTYRQFYQNNLGVLTLAYAGLLEQEDAVRTAEMRRDLGWNAPADAYDAACSLSRCIPIVAEHDKLDVKRRKEAVQFYGDAAMKLLRQAVTKGYKDVQHLKKDTDVDPLRGREDFKRLFAELEAKKG